MRVLFLILFSVPAFGASIYVRDGASGSGTSWTDAYDELSSAETAAARGDTIYVADGTYAATTWNTAVSGTSTITVKKATASAHGTETGWNSTYGDGQATLGNITVSTSYLVFDGANRNESDWDDATAYGFHIARNTSGSFVFSADIHHITIQYFDIGTSSTPSFGSTGFGIKATELTEGTWRNNITVSRCNFYNIGMMIHSRQNDSVTVEYCHIKNTYGKEVIGHQYGHDWIVRWNKFINCGIGSTIGEEPQTAVIGVFNYTGGGDPSLAQGDDWEIYGNVFACTDSTAQGNMEAQDALIAGSTVNNWKFHNNTIARIGGNWGGAIGLSGSGNIARNNLWWNMGDYAGGVTGLMIDAPANTDDSWCYYVNAKAAQSGRDCSNLPNTVTSGSETPFEDEASGDYRIKDSAFSGNTPAGIGDTSISAIYRTDANGVVHDNIGAFATAGEEGGDAAAPTLSSATIGTSGASITLAFNETVSVGAGGNGGFTISPSGGAATLTYSSGSGSSSLVYTISRTIFQSETGTISYTQPGSGIEDAAGNDLATFSGSSVTNNSTESSGSSSGVTARTGTVRVGTIRKP